MKVKHTLEGTASSRSNVKIAKIIILIDIIAWGEPSHETKSLPVSIFVLGSLSKFQKASGLFNIGLFHKVYRDTSLFYIDLNSPESLNINIYLVLSPFISRIVYGYAGDHTTLHIYLWCGYIFFAVWGVNQKCRALKTI